MTASQILKIPNSPTKTEHGKWREEWMNEWMNGKNEWTNKKINPTDRSHLGKTPV